MAKLVRLFGPHQHGSHANISRSRNAARWADFELLCVQDLSQRIEVLCGIESGEQLMRQTKARQEEYLAKGLPAFTEQLQPCVARIRSFITIAHEQLKDGDQSKLNVVWGIIDQLIAEIVEVSEILSPALPHSPYMLTTRRSSPSAKASSYRKCCAPLTT